MIKYEKITSKQAPEALGPYTQAIRAGGFVFLSGQIGIVPESGELAGTDIKTQTEQIMKNIGAVLKEAGISFDHVVKTTCFLVDMGDFQGFNEIYGKYFSERPARSCVAVKDMAKGAVVEVDVIAVDFYGTGLGK